MKWAKSAAAVSVSSLEGNNDGSGSFEIAIEDDGPGIPAEKAREAMQRGRRLDETKPGSGLGLAIVADLVNEYGGSLVLERSAMGGLKAAVRLRSVA
jgi:signal transduction histidine kinase